MRYSLVIFDLDGTLADSFPWFLGSLDNVADAFHLRRVRPEDVENLRRSDAREILAYLGVPRWKLPFIARHMRRKKSTELATINLFSGVDAILRALSDGGINLTLVSSDNEANARAILGRDNAALFSAFDCSAALLGKVSKFKRVIRRAGVDPSRVLAIGDEARDMEAARASGIDFAAVTWGYTAPEKLRAMKPDIVFERVGDIEEFLLRAEAPPAAASGG
jgi:phosphoglycolate phosphatase